MHHLRERVRVLGLVVFASCVLLACRPTLDATTLPGVDLERAFPALRFDRPVLLCGAGDGSNRIFVAEQAGVIRLFSKNDSVHSSKVFLDISGRVNP